MCICSDLVLSCSPPMIIFTKSSQEITMLFIWRGRWSEQPHRQTPHSSEIVFTCVTASLVHLLSAWQNGFLQEWEYEQNARTLASLSFGEVIWHDVIWETANRQECDQGNIWVFEQQHPFKAGQVLTGFMFKAVYENENKLLFVTYLPAASWMEGRSLQQKETRRTRKESPTGISWSMQEPDNKRRQI